MAKGRTQIGLEWESDFASSAVKQTLLLSALAGLAAGDKLMPNAVYIDGKELDYETSRQETITTDTTIKIGPRERVVSHTNTEEY